MAVITGGTNLITLQQYKDFAGLSGMSDDARINTIIPAISQSVKRYCGMSFLDYYSSNKTEFFDIKDNMTNAVMLDESPLVSIVSVEERGSQADSYVTLISENSDSSGKYDFTVDFESDTIFRTTDTADKMFPKGRKAVKVVYKAGYASTPSDIQLACFDLVKYYLKDERKERLNIGGATIQNQISSSIRDNIDFPDYIKRILDMYKVYK
jgi:hypothetical protein|tara:strand:- start:172 stop:801 length:630 start_codon:yes stop_codon:yes gene_type:complete